MGITNSITNFINIRKAAVAAPLAALLGGCLMEAPEPRDERPVSFSLEVRLSAAGEANPAVVDSAAGRRMEVTLASSAGDTLRDTITASGSRLSLDRTYLARTQAGQAVRARYALAAGRRWRATVRVTDPKDSVWYEGSGEPVSLRPFSEGSSSISLSPRYLVRGASLALPERVGGRRVCFSRVTLDVDGAAAKDSVAAASREGVVCGEAPGAFLKAGARAPVALSANYLAVGAHAVQVRAYGFLEGDTVRAGQARLLYEGGQQGLEASDAPLVLLWKASSVADAGDEARLVIRFGQIQTITVNAVMSGELSF